MKKSIKRLIIIIVAVGVIVGGIFIYRGMTSKAEEDAMLEAEPSFSEVTVGDVTLSVSGSGNLGSAETVWIQADSDFKIDEVLVEAGDSVAQGEPVALLDVEALQETADGLAEEILSLQTSIGTMNSVSTSLSIKSTADGWVKNAVLDEDEYIEDAMDEYGYVALVATQARQLIDASGSGLAEGDALRVKCEGRWHDGVVTRENGGLYVSIDTIYRTVGADAVVYDADGNELFTGQIELAAYETIESNFGIITDVEFSEDEEIEQGETIYQASQYSLEVQDLYVQLSDLREQYETVTAVMEAGEITAPSAGVVGSVSVSDGQACAQGEQLLSIESTESWVATVSVDELDISTVEIGQRVEVSLDSMPDEVFEGEVVRISELGTAASGITTYDVDISVKPDEGFMLAMTLNCEIVTQQAENVLLVPVEAVRTANRGSYVMVSVERTDAQIEAITRLIEDNDYTALADYMGEDATQMGVQMLSDPSALLYGEVRTVETGIEDATYIEIISGLSEEESVLLQASDDDNAFNAMMPGMGMMIENGGSGVRPDGGGRSNGGGAPPNQ